MKKVSDVLGCQRMKCFVSEEEDFVADALFDWQPMEFLEDGGDVLPGLGVG